MKNLIVFSFVFLTLNSFGQDDTKGKVFSTIFWNFNSDFTKNASMKNAFEIKRVYLGYNYNLDDKLSAKITFDVGKNSSGSSYTAFLKTAQIDWKLEKNVKLSFGMIGNKQFKFQEKIWGYRYVYKTFQDENKFGSSADIGVNAEFKLSNNLTFNAFILNGEGYKNLQDDDGYMKIGGNLIYEFSNGLSAKLYYDSEPGDENFNVTNVGYFIGYSINKSRIGIEYNKINNAESYNNPSLDSNLSGYSFYGSQKVGEKGEIYARYDNLESNTLIGNSAPWNFDKDGKLLIFGYQTKIRDGFKLSFNYRNYKYLDNSKNNKSMFFINAEIKI